MTRFYNLFSEVFADELGTLQGSKASIHIDPNIPPKFCKARSLPYAMKDKVEKEFQKLENQGIILPVKYSKWTTPIVPILKQDKQYVGTTNMLDITCWTLSTPKGRWLVCHTGGWHIEEREQEWWSGGQA